MSDSYRAECPSFCSRTRIRASLLDLRKRLFPSMCCVHQCRFWLHFSQSGLVSHIIASFVLGGADFSFCMGFVAPITARVDRSVSRTVITPVTLTMFLLTYMCNPSLAQRGFILRSGFLTATHVDSLC